MANFSQYYAKQNTVYTEFRTAMRSISRVNTSPYVKEPMAGYLVAFQYNTQLMDALTTFLPQISACIPSKLCSHNSIHTTITVYQQQSFQRFRPDEKILKVLDTACQEIEPHVLRAVSITFHEWLFNREAVIVAGQPNDAFWEVGERVQRNGKRHGLDLRMPWGAHITVARYLRDSEKVNELASLVKKAPILEESKPATVWVGHYLPTKTGIELVPYSTLEC
jgi:hypothetical protein